MWDKGYCSSGLSMVIMMSDVTIIKVHLILCNNYGTKTHMQCLMTMWRCPYLIIMYGETID